MTDGIKISVPLSNGRPNLANLDSETATNIKRVSVHIENYIRDRAAMNPGVKSQVVLIGYVEEWLRGAK